MQPPGWRPEWHVSVRVAKNKKLVGFIAGMPCDIRVYNKWVFFLIFLSLVGSIQLVYNFFTSSSSNGSFVPLFRLFT